jgi:hypothetical protein
MPCLTEAEFRDHLLIRALADAGLDGRDFAIYGSAQLLVHNLRPIEDLDIVARGDAWARAQHIGVAALAAIDNAPVMLLGGGAIEIYNTWVTREASVDQLIDESEIIYGVPFVTVDHVISYKAMLRRAKDITDIELLQAHIRDGRRRCSIITTPRPGRPD